jgi:hypothetical protein
MSGIGKVNNRKAPVAEDGPVVRRRPYSLPVWPPMPQSTGKGFDERPLGTDSGSKCSRYSTHIIIFRFLCASIRMTSAKPPVSFSAAAAPPSQFLIFATGYRLAKYFFRNSSTGLSTNTTTAHEAIIADVVRIRKCRSKRILMPDRLMMNPIKMMIGP